MRQKENSGSESKAECLYGGMGQCMKEDVYMWRGGWVYEGEGREQKFLP